MTDANFATAKEVAAALTAIRFPVPNTMTLSAISRICRSEFLGALAACVAEQDADGVHRQFIERILEITSPATLERLKGIDQTATIDALVAIGAKGPVRFLSALAVAADPENPRHDEARAVVTNMLAAATRAAEPPAPPADPVSQDEPRDVEPQPPASGPHRSVHVYGSSYALCFNAVQGRNNEPGIMVDAAASAGPRAYDWKNAIHLMLDAREVACVFAVFRKWRPSVEFSAHGAKNDKSFAIERQGANFFAKVAAKGAGVRAVKILPQDAHKVAILFLEQLLLAYPKVPETEVIALVRSINSTAASPRAAAGGQ